MPKSKIPNSEIVIFIVGPTLAGKTALQVLLTQFLEDKGHKVNQYDEGNPIIPKLKSEFNYFDKPRVIDIETFSI